MNGEHTLRCERAERFATIVHRGMSMSLASKDRDTARKKGLIATAATAGSVALIAAGAAPVLCVVAIVPTALLVKDWFMFRAKRGMRF
jgi:hypothetical protein